MAAEGRASLPGPLPHEQDREVATSDFEHGSLVRVPVER
jgi:hypothetical protein